MEPVVSAPQQIAGYWAALTVERNVSPRVVLHLSIAISSAGDVRGGDLVVEMRAGPNDTVLPVKLAPPVDRALPYLEAGGRTAIADYQFDNAAALKPSRLTVTLKGETVSFDVAALLA